MRRSSLLKSEDHQHFSLRKLTVGVASVLVGTTFMMFGGNTAHAATVNTNQNQTVLTDTSNIQTNKQLNKANTQVTATQNAHPAANQQPQQGTVTKAAAPTAQTQVKSANLAAAQQTQPQYKNPVEVSNWNDLTSAIRNKSVDEIVLNNDINATGYRETAFNTYRDWNISRQLTITSKNPDQHNTINFGDHFYSFWDINQKKNGAQDNTTPWDIILKDVDITNTDQVFSPFFFNNESVWEANRSKFTLDNVNQRGDMVLRSEQVNVEMKNNVNINSTLHNGDYSAIYAHSVKIDPNANVVMNVSDTSDSWYLYGDAAISIVSTNTGTGLEVGEGATLKINPDQTVDNTKGIIIDGNSQVLLDKNSDVEMNLGRGNTTGIFGARNLILSNDATLNINTYQDNNGIVAWGDNNNGHHVSPITLGSNQVSYACNTLEVMNGATLRIVRKDSGREAIAGLISFGSYSTNAHSNQRLYVDDGATLDLQDAAQSNWHEYGDRFATYLDAYKDPCNLPTTALINMYGIDATDDLHFGNVKYVNLQRTGYQHGILIRLEGGSRIGGNTAVIDATNMPLNQWYQWNYSDQADWSWNIDHVNTTNKWGDYAYNYNKNGQYLWNQYQDQEYNGVPFFNVDGSVKFSDGKSLYDHRSFNCFFNWWAPQRLTFGSIYEVATTKPSITDDNALTTHVNANINQSPSLSVNDIKLTWTDDKGNAVAAPKDYTINWIKDPNTSKATGNDSLDRTGQVIVKVGNTSYTLAVPVKVLSALAVNGQEVMQGDPAPAAKNSVNTTDVDRFGVVDDTWVKAPDTSKPGAAIPGTVRVDYQDGTSQNVEVTVNVLGVEKGIDHKDDHEIYLSNDNISTLELTNGQIQETITTVIISRDRITNYALPEGDPNRVTYTDWKMSTNTQVKIINNKTNAGLVNK